MNIFLKTGKGKLILLEPVAPPGPGEDPGDACHGQVLDQLRFMTQRSRALSSQPLSSVERGAVRSGVRDRPF